MNLIKIFTYAIILAVVLFIYWPVFRWLVNSWLSNEFYSHGFLVPLVSAFFIWTKRAHLRKEEHSVFGYFFLALGGLSYAINLIWDIQYLGALSFILVITSLILLFLGKRSVMSILFPLVFLIFMIPFPFVRDPRTRNRRRIPPWQELSARRLGASAETHPHHG